MSLIVVTPVGNGWSYFCWACKRGKAAQDRSEAFTLAVYHTQQHQLDPLRKAP